MATIPSSTYFNTVHSRSAFRRRYPDSSARGTQQSGGVHVVSGSPSGSSWSTEELKAHHVICQQTSGVTLPILEEVQIPDGNAQIPERVKHAIDDFNAAELHEFPSETEIFRSLDGHMMSAFWGALVHLDPTALSPVRSHRQSDSLLMQRDQPLYPPGTPPPGGHRRKMSALSSSTGGGSLSPHMGSSNDTRMGGNSGGVSDHSPGLPIRGSPPGRSRPRTKIAREDYVDSATIVVSSSQGQRSSPLESQHSNTEYVDRSTHATNAGAFSEDHTMHLLQSFIRPVLHLLQSRDATSLLEVDVRKRYHRAPWFMRASASASAGGGVGQPQQSRCSSVVAVDNGGLALRARDARGHWTILAERVAIIEAKRGRFFNDDGELVLADNVLGQMLAEALMTRLGQSNRDLLLSDGEHVLVISAAQQYVQVLDFHIPDAYVRAIGSLDKDNDSHFIIVTTTKVLNLARPEDRVQMARFLQLLIEWTVQVQEPRMQEDDEDDERDGGDDDGEDDENED